MPCRGPDWEPPSEKDILESKLREHVQYVTNTATLLEHVLTLLNREIDKRVIDAKSITDLNIELSDYVTKELCEIFEQIKSDHSVQSIIQLSPYVAHLSFWKYEHDKLDKKRNNGTV